MGVGPVGPKRGLRHMVGKPLGSSGASLGTTALGLMVITASALVGAETGLAQTFAAQLQSPAPITAAAPAAGVAAPVAAAPKAAATVKTIAASPPTLGGAKTAAAPEPAVRPDKTRTRFVIGLDKSTEFQISTLANPNRVVVDLPDVRIQLPPDVTANQGGLVKSFYGGLSAPGKAKVVITVDGPVVVESHKIESSKDGKTHRLVLELAAFDAKTHVKKAAASAPAGSVLAAPTFTLGAVGMAPPMPKQAVRPSVAATKAYKPIIVIDPGHGGHDSGASKFGTIEKNVVLAFSLALRDKLNATGRYIVKMTRDSDVFIPLDQRRDFAEQTKANLFIAVHADYAGAKARGATIYSLRDNVAKDLQRSSRGVSSDNLIAAKDEAQIKQANAEQLGTVKGILGDLAQREVSATKDSTGIFARSVIETMGETTSMQSNPDRSAAFRVLKSASVPAVLIELAYVTNQQDAANLKSDVWRDKVSASITAAVENYFSNQNAYLLKVGG
jgi:N-acetylmuramoyl-L-alanine amidase